MKNTTATIDAPTPTRCSTPANRLEELIQNRDVISLGELTNLLASDSTTIHTEMRDRIRSGKVECLQPVTTPDRSPSEVEPGDIDLVYYRWRRNTDSDYLWEQDLSDFYHSPLTPVLERPPDTAMHAKRDGHMHPLGHFFRTHLQTLIS